ncbi:MAG: hypothetical protein FJW35_16860, partial [Acidobacteria bacterium]|nr:hypothetical protein [Acidobacteriota bacterium]
MMRPLRRATIVVSDLERSLAFYRDILSLRVFYDQVIDAEATGRLLGVPGAKVRLVSLQAGDSVEGMVGLLSFLTPPARPREEVRKNASA